MIWRLLNDPMAIVYRLVAVVIALSVHEWAHAYAAYRMGDTTARDMGRMTVDPLRHMDLFGFLAMLLVGFGWAKPVPVNPNNIRHGRWGEIFVSIAGVLMNFLMAFVATFLFVWLWRGNAIALSYGTADWTTRMFYDFLTTFMSINIGIMVFNLLPVPPLDGYRVAKGLLLGKTKNLNIFWTMERYGSLVLFALVVFDIITPVLSWAMNGVVNGMLSVAGAVLGVPV